MRKASCVAVLVGTLLRPVLAQTALAASVPKPVEPHHWELEFHLAGVA